MYYVYICICIYIYIHISSTHSEHGLSHSEHARLNYDGFCEVPL